VPVVFKRLPCFFMPVAALKKDLRCARRALFFFGAKPYAARL